MRTPPWGETPALSPEPVIDIHATLVEVRPDAPRHLLECYGTVVRCVEADARGFTHPGISAASRELRRIRDRIDGLFAGSIIEVVPVTDEIAPGHRVARAVVTDVYRINNVDVRGCSYIDRRAFIDELLSVADRDVLRAAPLLRVRESAERSPRELSTSVTGARLVPRGDSVDRP